jgi:hypothetical protein
MAKSKDSPETEVVDDLPPAPDPEIDNPDAIEDSRYSPNFGKRRYAKADVEIADHGALSDEQVQLVVEMLKRVGQTYTMEAFEDEFGRLCCATYETISNQACIVLKVTRGDPEVYYSTNISTAALATEPSEDDEKVDILGDIVRNVDGAFK